MASDAAAWNNQPHFILPAMLIWGIHDFPAFGMVSGCVTKGYYGCPICGPHTQSRCSRALRKNVWDNDGRGYLLVDHPWRTDDALFYG
jgi:hypothetical protein